MEDFFTDDVHLESWIDESLSLKAVYGSHVALCYIIGEKLYNMMTRLASAGKMMTYVERERAKPGYDSFCQIKTAHYTATLDLEKAYDKEMIAWFEMRECIERFSEMIVLSYEGYEIRQYFSSHPVLGAMGVLAARRALTGGHYPVNRPLEVEIENALILGEMEKSFVALQEYE